jgi:hypothetical protein
MNYSKRLNPLTDDAADMFPAEIEPQAKQSPLAEALPNSEALLNVLLDRQQFGPRCQHFFDDTLNHLVRG